MISENVKIEIQINEQLKEKETLKLQIEELVTNEAFLLVMDTMNAEYNREFNNALQIEDAVLAKYALERMKAIGYCKNIIISLSHNNEQEIEYLRGERME